MTLILKSFKIRAYPTLEQRQAFARIEGACRFVRRRVLEEMHRYHQETGGYKSVIDMSREVTQWKKWPETAWLQEIPSSPITQELRDLGQGFSHFFAGRARYLKKKSKQSACAIRFQLDQRQRSLHTAWAEQTVRIPTLGTIKIAQPERLGVPLPKMMTFSRDSAGRYFISFGVEVEMAPLPRTGVSIGVDVGINTLAVLSTGEKEPNPQALKRKQRYLRRYQRQLSRKVGARKGEKKSRRYLRAQQKVGKLHAKITDLRKDHAHKVSLKIVRVADVVALEDLAVKGMMKNHRLAQSLSDAGFRHLRTLIEYKSRWYGREVLISNRWVATSKTCSACDYVMKELPLSVRSWDCPGCGAVHDGNINAAKTILRFAVGSGRSEGGVSPDARGGRTPLRESALADSSKASCEARTAHLSENPKILPHKAWKPRAA